MTQVAALSPYPCNHLSLPLPPSVEAISTRATDRYSGVRAIFSVRSDVGELQPLMYLDFLLRSDEPLSGAPSVEELLELVSRPETRPRRGGISTVAGWWTREAEDLLCMFESVEQLRELLVLRSQEQVQAGRERAVAEAEAYLEAATRAAASKQGPATPLGPDFEPRLIRSFLDAEVAARDWLRSQGHRDAEVTISGADGGVDVVGRLVVAQVKAEMVLTGRPVVQQIAGIAALEGKEAMCFSLSGYTSEARQWAARAQVRLFRFDLQGCPEPVPPTGT